MNFMGEIRKILAEGDSTSDEILEEIPLRINQFHYLIATMLKKGHVERVGVITKKVTTTRHMVVYRLTPQGKYRLEHPQRRK